MRNVSDTIARLAAFRQASQSMGSGVGAGRLTDAKLPGSNPGALKARMYLPPKLEDGAPLVVVLHGCTQTAAAYDAGSGWSTLAEELGFALLFPEQQASNNPNLCFNWFNPSDAARGEGEAQSIATMIEAMIATHRLDRSRVFITGLSAGGAMAAAMLASYPEMFAGGGIVAGLPYGVANTVPEAFDRMRGHGGPAHTSLQALLDTASGHGGPWPKISIWHGTDDRTVSPANADDLFAQWQAVHDLGRLPSRTETVGRATRRVWLDSQGVERVEFYSVRGMGHGTPLATAGSQGLGHAAPYMLDVGICSTRRMAAFWGLTDAVLDGQADMTPESTVKSGPGSRGGLVGTIESEPHRRPVPAFPRTAGISDVIEDALRKAGLMR